MHKRILFIINPISGVGRHKTVEKAIESTLDKSLFIPEIAYTQHAKHAIEISKNAVGKFDVIVAIGGDGSINEISQNLINTDTILGIIPTGSGNGLARYLKIPLDVRKAIQVINRLAIKKIDTLTINDRRFVNVAGVGFDAKVGHVFANLGMRGFLGYFAAIAKTIFSYKPKKYKIFIDGKKYKKRLMQISIANSSQFGFNAHISPNSKIDDGLIEICFVKPVPVLISPFVGMRLFFKNFDKSRYSKIKIGKEVLIKHKKHITAHIDGEPVDLGNELRITVNPLSLNVIIP